MSARARLAGSAAGLLVSRVLPALGDHAHPVARFGASMRTVEELLWRDERRAGVAYAAVGTALSVSAGRAVGSVTATVAVCAAGRQLRDVATEVASAVESGDLDAARDRLPALVGRDPSALDGSGIAAAAIESVAENMVDAVFGPAFWAVVAGAPGAALHRGLNTMDAMVGHRDSRYERFGWAAARADDVANLLPARLFALALAGARPERAGEILTAVRRDAPAHPSPNAGVAEAAMAAGLGVELGGPVRYGDRREDRPRLGDGPRPGPEHVLEAVELSRRTEDIAVVALAAGALLATVGARR